MGAESARNVETFTKGNIVQKPREFWIEYSANTGMPIKAVKQTFQPTIYTRQGTEWVSVVPKSAADKLAEALEEFLNYNECRCEYWKSGIILTKALKEYRGEKP